MLGHVLVVNPGVGLPQPLGQRDARLPSKELADPCVVGIPTVDSLRRAEIVLPLELQARNLLHDVHELVDGDELARTQIDGLLDLARRDRSSALDAIVDVHERAGLLTAPPDRDFARAGEHGLDALAADGRWRLLAAALPRAVRAVHIVIAGHSRDQPEILAKMPAHALGKEFLPPVSILRHRGIGILLFERDDLRAPLLIRVVDTCRGRVEKPLRTGLEGSLQHMSVGEDGEHTTSLVVLDEADAAHVRRELIDDVGPAAGRNAGLFQFEIGDDVLDVIESLLPFRDGFAVYGSYRMALATEISDEMSPDEPASPGHYDELITHRSPAPLPPDDSSRRCSRNSGRRRHKRHR